jgi:PhnB protein
MSKNDITLTPYLHFHGNCEEALETYQKILDGTIEIVQRYDNPSMQAPDHYKNKILHAKFRFGNHDVYASDAFPSRESESAYSNIALSISLSNLEKAQKIYYLLSEGGRIGVPFAKQFWGDWHGNFIDRFGIQWMINVEAKSESLRK